MTTDLNSALLAEFSATEPLYHSLAFEIERLIKNCLSEHGIRVHSVTSRCKTSESFAKKLQKPGAEYHRLGDVTDIAGVRVITYFEGDVELVADTLRTEFVIDWEHSVDKRETLDPDRFGYLSLHYIASLHDDRAQLTEYRRFAGLRFEIQIRSILQHAWAEIEHDLGYKSKHSIPRVLRRRFSRVAGLLELADAEFAAIRTALSEYESTVSERIESSPATVTIDQASLGAFIRQDPLVAAIDRIIWPKASLVTLVDDGVFFASALARLAYVDIRTIADLKASLAERRTLLIEFIRCWVPPYHEMVLGTCVTVLPILIAASTEDVRKVRDFVDATAQGEYRIDAHDAVEAFRCARRATG